LFRLIQSIPSPKADLHHAGRSQHHRDCPPQRCPGF
jgi:hypothetical protein